jgi:putative acetyltransferase
VLIRPELLGDVEDIRAVHAAAFHRPDSADDPREAWLVDELRASDAWMDRLSLVAVEGGAVVGHVACTRAVIEPGQHPVLGLAPLGVRPDCQGRGIGQALVRAVVSAADALGEPLVALVGSPDYYARFGFEPAADLGIEPTVAQWRPHFQALRLTGYEPSLQGTFQYAEPFSRL